MSKCTCGKGDAIVACDICLQKAYCCAACKPLGWSIHQDQCNVHIASKPDTTVFTPQFDDYDPKRVDGNEEFLQSHIVRYVSPKAEVQEQLIGAEFTQSLKKLGGGHPVDEDKDYMLRVSGNGIIPKTIRVIPVFKGSRDSRSDQLASQKTYDMSKVVFWSSERVNIDIPTRGELKVLLLVNGSKTGRALIGDYKLPSSESVLGDWARKVKSQLLRKEYETKGFSSAVVNTFLTMKASTRNGNMCRFTVQMSKGKGGSATVPMIDIEFACKLTDLQRGGFVKSSVPVDSAEPADYSQQIKCDATDIDQVTALVLAMEDGMASGELEGFEDRFNIINAHREGLMATGINRTNPKVQSAIYDAVNALIAAKNGKLTFADRASEAQLILRAKRFKTEQQFQTEFDKWLRQANVLAAQDGADNAVSLRFAQTILDMSIRRGFALKVGNFYTLARGGGN